VKIQKSETMKVIFPMNRILAVADLTSAAYYRKRPVGKEKARRGPKPKISDEDLLVEIRTEILTSTFMDEGYKKIWRKPNWNNRI